MNYLKKNYFFLLTIIFAFFLRLLSFYFFRDYDLDNEWGILFKNYQLSGVIGINVFDGNEIIAKVANKNEIILPSIYMPPLYLFFIIFLSFIVSEQILVNTILIIQIFISILSSYFIFRILEIFFKKEVCKIGFVIFLYFPLNIYASSQISSITLQIFLITLFFYSFHKLLDRTDFKNIFVFSIFSAALILLRGEFFLILLFTYVFYFLRSKKLKSIFFSLLIILVFLSPYLIRNYLVFNEITITKSGGFNLWKGNNLYSNVEGNEKLYDLNMIEQIDNLEPNNFYEINKDEIYKIEGIKNIKSNTKKYVILYFKKIFSFIFYHHESSYPHYYNLFHLIPKIFLGVFSIIGIFILNFKNNNLTYYSGCLIFYILLYSIFFILPRYQLSVLPIQIILTCVVLQKFFIKLKKISS